MNGKAAGKYLFALAMAVIVSPAMADLPSNSQSLVAEKDVRKAKVILMPDPIEMLYKPKEKNLVELGCTYITEDRSAINALIGLLNSFDMRPNANADYMETNPYQAIYLELSDGTTRKYLFNIAASGQRVQGVSAKSGSFNAVPFTAAPVAKSLREWSSTVGKQTNHGPQDLLRENCDKN